MSGGLQKAHDFMRFIYSIFLLFSISSYSTICAQNQTLEPCATQITPEVLSWFNSLDHSFRKNMRLDGGQLYVPVVIHIVGNDNGSGYFPKDQAYQLICELNRQYVPVSIRFFLADTFYYINNSKYYNHDWNDGYQMMDFNNVPTVMNVYIVQNPSGACGYAYYPGGGPGNGRGGIALAKSCARPGNSTFPHEVGHYLSLPHTFDNWNSSGVSEFVNGTNCASAGDYFCDTPADYLDYRWNCPYTGTKLDLNGDPYQPDGSFYMSYSIEPCGKRFSQEQIDAMRISRSQDRTYLNAVPAPNYIPEQTTTLVIPFDSATVPTSGFMLRWNKIPGIQEYAGLITPYPSFAFATVKFYTTDTFYYVSEYLNNATSYRWKVNPISPFYPCMDLDSMSSSREFTTDASMTGTAENLQESDYLIMPVPATASEIITLQFPTTHQSNSISVVDLSGKTIAQYRIESGISSYQIPANSLKPGCYMIQYSQRMGNLTTQRILVY